MRAESIRIALRYHSPHMQKRSGELVILQLQRHFGTLDLLAVCESGQTAEGHLCYSVYCTVWVRKLQQSRGGLGEVQVLNTLCTTFNTPLPRHPLLPSSCALCNNQTLQKPYPAICSRILAWQGGLGWGGLVHLVGGNKTTFLLLPWSHTFARQVCAEGRLSKNAPCFSFI